MLSDDRASGWFPKCCPPRSSVPSQSTYIPPRHNPDTYILSCVALFSHNPGITEFVNTLTAETKVDNMPTCSVFAVKADINSWQEFVDAKKELWFFDFPKNGKD